MAAPLTPSAVSALQPLSTAQDAQSPRGQSATDNFPDTIPTNELRAFERFVAMRLDSSARLSPEQFDFVRQGLGNKPLPVSDRILCMAIKKLAYDGERYRSLDSEEIFALRTSFRILAHRYGIEDPVTAFDGNYEATEMLGDMRALLAKPEIREMMQREGVTLHRSPVDGRSVLGSLFDRRRDPFTGRWAEHKANDFEPLKDAEGKPIETPIYASAGGKVVAWGYHEDFGNFMILQHHEGYTLYAHMRDLPLNFKYGDTLEDQKENVQAIDNMVCIERGRTRFFIDNSPIRYGRMTIPESTIIGYMGNTGHSEGVHLHYEQLVSLDMNDLVNKGLIHGERRMPIYASGHSFDAPREIKKDQPVQPNPELDMVEKPKVTVEPVIAVASVDSGNSNELGRRLMQGYTAFQEWMAQGIMQTQNGNNKVQASNEAGTSTSENLSGTPSGAGNRTR